MGTPRKVVPDGRGEEPILAPGQCFQQPNPNTVARLGTACGPAGANRSEADLAMYQLACVSAVFSSFPTTASLGMERSRPQTEPWRSGPRKYYSKYTRDNRRVCGTGVWSVPATSAVFRGGIARGVPGSMVWRYPIHSNPGTVPGRRALCGDVWTM